MKRNITITAVVAVVALAAVWFLWLRGPAETTEDVAKPATAEKVRVKGDKAERQDRGSGSDMAVLMEDDPEGNLMLEGQVVRGGTTPVAGAVVTIDSNPPRTTKSGEDGSFSFDKLVPRRYALVARDGRGSAGPVTARLSETNDPVVLDLKDAGAVLVKVISAGERTALSGATVELRGIERRIGTTDNRGESRFTAVNSGRYEVVAFAPGFAKQHEFVRVSAGADETLAHVELKKGAAVSGVVKQGDGKPVVGARVLYSGASQWAQSADPRFDAAVTDGSGVFRFESMPKGSFRFVARADGMAPGASEIVTLDGINEKSGINIVVEPGATLRGVVINTRDEPVPSARVRAQVRSRGMRWTRVRQVFTDADGRFELPGLPKQNVEVVATSDLASSSVEEIDFSQAPAQRDVSLTLDVDGKIAGIVVDSDGEPIEGAQVTVWPDFSRRGGGRRNMWLRGFPEELTDAGGRFEIGGLDPGTYTVRATPPGVAGRGRGFLREGIEAETGTTDVRVVLEKDGGLKGEVAFESGDAPTMFTVDVGFRTRTPFSNAEGTFELRDLPPQSYTLTVRGPDFAAKRVVDIEVKPGKVVDLGELIVFKGRSVSGRVVSSSGTPVEGALVLAGRVLFGDGASAKAQRSPPWARNSKETRTDENGDFNVSGIAKGEISIVAEHEDVGRSAVLTIPQSQQSLANVEMILAGFGAVQGSVTKNGEPVATRVTASSATNPRVSQTVAAGEDGTFRFDRLGPDNYNVSAMVGSPMSGMGMYTRTATVRSDKTTTVNIVVNSGEIELTVDIKASNSDKTGFSRLYAVVGEIKADSARDLEFAIAALGDGYSNMGMSIRGAPAVIEELKPGSYTVCVVPYPLEVEGMGGVMGYMEREGDNLKPFCEAVVVTESPAKQAITMTVELPEFVPETTDEG